MTEIKDTERELQLFRMRLSVAGLVVFICFGLLMLRFVMAAFSSDMVVPPQIQQLCSKPRQADP